MEFVQYMDDYLLPENQEFKRWVFEEYIEQGLERETLKLGQVEVIGGLGSVGLGWERLESGKVRGTKLVIRPDLE